MLTYFVNANDSFIYMFQWNRILSIYWLEFGENLVVVLEREKTGHSLE